MGDGKESADAELWERVVSGEPQAFERLFDRHTNAIFRFCVRRVGDRSAAEDLMSTTFLHAWRRRADMQCGAEGPVPWLYGIAANLVRRHLRGVDRRRAGMARVPAPGAEPDPSDEIADRLDGASRADRVREALMSLPDSDQELFVLCVWEELCLPAGGRRFGHPGRHGSVAPLAGTEPASARAWGTRGRKRGCTDRKHKRSP
jgi:RNA polymerase sigma factor (sigma-70 family)